MNQPWNPQQSQATGFDQQQQQPAPQFGPPPAPQPQAPSPFMHSQFSAQNYQVPGFMQQQMMPPPQAMPSPLIGQEPGMLPLEQSFIENILRLNRGKLGTFYMTYENNAEWNARIFRGRVEEAGRDHIIISDPETGTYFLLLMLNLDYVTFEEPIEYDYPFGGMAPLAQYAPRPE